MYSKDNSRNEVPSSSNFFKKSVFRFIYKNCNLINIRNSVHFCIIFCDRLFHFKHFKNPSPPLKVSHVLSLTPTFSIKIDERNTRERNAHAMQIVKATSSCQWPECGLWRQSTVRRSGNGGNVKRAGEEALTRGEAGARVRFRFLSLSLFLPAIRLFRFTRADPQRVTLFYAGKRW